WRRQVAGYLRSLGNRRLPDRPAEQLAELLQGKREVIGRLAARAERLAAVLAGRPFEPKLCHGDIHAGNLLVDASDRVYIVDWDTLVIAPKERDLMFVGGGVGGRWNKDREADWFFEGYGETEIDRTA